MPYPFSWTRPLTHPRLNRQRRKYHPPRLEQLEDRNQPVAIFTTANFIIDSRPDNVPLAVPRAITLNGSPAAFGDQVAIANDVSRVGSNMRDVFVLDTNGEIRMKHYDLGEPNGFEDRFGTNFRLPLGLITTDGTTETSFINSNVQSIDIDTSDANIGRFTIIVIGSPSTGPNGGPTAIATAPVVERWVITLYLPGAELTEVRIDTTATFIQPVTLSAPRLASAEAFRAFEFFSSNVPDANTTPPLPATHNADNLRVLSSQTQELASVDLTAQTANTLIFPTGLVYDGLLELNQLTPAPLYGDTPNLTAQILPASDNPQYKAQGIKTVVPMTTTENTDNVRAWASRTLANPIIPLGTEYRWSVLVAATETHLNAIPKPLARQLVTGGTADGVAQTYLRPQGAPGYAPAFTVRNTPIGPLGANVRTAVGDVNGDGFLDDIFVTGPGAAIRATVISGVDHRSVLIQPFDPFGGDFTGGGFVAAGDFNGDGLSEFVVTPDLGGGARVSVFSFLNGQAKVRSNFLGINDPNFRGGARVGTGDINGDGIADLAVSAGFLGGPRIAVYNGASLLGAPGHLTADFFAFSPVLRDGAYVAIGDVNGDGFGDLIFGAGDGGAPHVLVASGAQLLSNGGAAAVSLPLASFYAGDTSTRGGVRVAAIDVDDDGRADIAAGSGKAQFPQVLIYRGANVRNGSLSPYETLFPIAELGVADGVFVG